jgi:hypothetical protein
MSDKVKRPRKAAQRAPSADQFSWETCKDCGQVYVGESDRPPQEGVCPKSEIAPGSVLRHLVHQKQRGPDGGLIAPEGGQFVDCRDCRRLCWYPTGTLDATLCVDCSAVRAINEGEVQLLLAGRSDSTFNFEFAFEDQAAIRRLVFDAVRSEDRFICAECEGSAALLFLPVDSSSRPPLPAGTKAARIVSLCESCSAELISSKPPRGNDGPN